MEVSFFVETDALKRLCPKMSDVEAGVLEAFDAARNRIHEVANKVYMGSRKGSYSFILAAGEF